MEKTVMLSRGELKIFCKQTEPDFGGIRRVVLSVHGLGGSTEDAIQTSIAEEMEIFSSATIRFDFPVHGRSPLTDEYFTLENCKQSLMAAAQYAKEQYPQVEDLCIFATGFGAYMALICLEELVKLPGKIHLVVQTPSVLMHETLLSMKHISLPSFRAMGEIKFTTRRPLTVKYSFYEELTENLALVPPPIPMLILHGEEDAYIRSRLQDTILWSCQCHNACDRELDYGLTGWMSERYCHSQGLLTETYPDGSPASTWFALMPWACGSILEGLAGAAWDRWQEE